MYAWMRPLLFQLEPEKAHYLVMQVLQRLQAFNLLRFFLACRLNHIMSWV